MQPVMSVNFLYGIKNPASASAPLSFSSSDTRLLSTSLSKGMVSILWKVVARVGGRSSRASKRAMAPLDGVAFP